ncbi:MAG: putative porin [Bacteroidales bacterium]|nr:putative porin [Bacteroidales bacterium]
MAKLMSYLLLLLLLPFSLFADKLDSLLQIHDTSTIIYYYNRTDNLAVGNFNKVGSNRVTGFQRYNPLDQSGRFYASFSNVGQAHKNLVFRPKLSDGFFTGMESFDVYTFTNENTRYYRHLIPITYLVYDNGSQKEQLFRVIHSHTIKRTVTLGVDFFLINSPGTYINQKSDDKSVVFTGQYFTKNLRFGAIANYHHNKFIVRENGGIVNDTIFEEKLETDSRLFDVNLPTAQNLIKESGVLANAYFYLSGKPELKDSTITKPPTFHAGRISYTFNYTRQIQVYSDTDPLATFYQPFDPVIDSSETFDSLQVQSFDNHFSWSNLRMGDKPEQKYLLIIFSIANKHSFISDSISKRSFNNWIPEAAIIIRPYRSMAIHLSGKYTLGDFNNGGFELKGMANQSFKLKNNKTGDINLSFITASQQAGYFFTNFQSNYFRWDTSFSSQIIQQAALSLNFLGIEGKVEYHLISDYVYLDQSAHPAQYKGSINIVKASLSDEFRWKVWGIDALLVYQYNSNKELIRVPDFLARVSFFPTLPLFKNACILQPGIDLFYNTAYYASAYMPASRMFYLQDEKKIGNYVYMDVFINLMVKRFRFFIKYQHLNFLFSESRYYMVPHYPMQDGIIKFGLSWSFYD